MRRSGRVYGRRPTLGDMARLSCLERLFVVLFAFIVFSALPGVAPLVATYGQFGPDPAPAGRTHLAGAPAANPVTTPSAPSSGELLTAAHWSNVALVVAYEFESTAFVAPVQALVHAVFDVPSSSAVRFSRLGIPTASYDAQAPPAV